MTGLLGATMRPVRRSPSGNPGSHDPSAAAEVDGIRTGLPGVVTLSSVALDRMPSFRSTLRHELGHSFGLPHVNACGYNMSGNPSIMGYDSAHHTDGFHASATPGTLIPEDLRGLAKNQRVLPMTLPEAPSPGER